MKAEKFIAQVVDCRYLNIRKEPSLEAEIIGALEINDKVFVDIELSTNEFYAISNQEIEIGYCLKEYIDILKGRQ